MEKVIAGLRPLEQFMEEGSFLMPEIPALLRVIQAMGAPEYMDYDYLLSLSGMAVRFAWQQGWAAYEGLPNQAVFYNQGGRGIVEIAADRIGLEYRKRLPSKAAAEEIKASLDRGVPVLMEHQDWAWGTILGYDGDSLLAVSVFADKGKRDPRGFNLLTGWERGLESYTLFSRFRPRPMDGGLLAEVLETAVYLARTARQETLKDTALGVSAFDALAELLAWDEGFAPLEPGKEFDGQLEFPYSRPEGYYRTDGAGCLSKRFWAGYCDFLCMLNGCENFSRFLVKYRTVLPQWEGALSEAAENYRRAAGYSEALWAYVTPDEEGAAKFKDKDVRYAFAAHMLQAKIYILRAVEIFERLLKNR